MTSPPLPARGDSLAKAWRVRLLGGSWRLLDLEFFHLLVVAIGVLTALLTAVLVVAMTRTDGTVVISVSFVACLVAMMVVVRAAARAGLRSAERRTAAAASLHAREALLDAIARGATVRAGAASSLINHGADEIGAYYARAIPARAVARIAPLMVLVVLVVVDPWSALCCAVVVAIAPFVLARIGRRAAAEATVGLARLRSLAARALELLEGAIELRALGALARGREEIAAATERTVSSVRRSLRLGVQSATALDVLAGAAVGIVSMLNGLRLLNGSMSLGHAIGAAFVTIEVFVPLRAAGAAFHAAADGRAALEALDAIVADAQPPRGEPSTALPRAAAVPAIVTVRGASIAAVRGADTAIEGLSITVEPRTSLCVTGASGSGKTTLLRAIAGLAAVTSGTVRVANADPVRLSSRQRAALFAMVDQRPFLIAGSMRDNLVLGGRTVGADVLERAVRDCGLGSVLERSPLRLDQPVGEAGRLLSAGERTRLVLARAVVRAPGIVLLDEVGANLDDESITELRHSLSGFLATRTVIEAAHDRPLLVDAARLSLDGALAGAR